MIAPKKATPIRPPVRPLQCLQHPPGSAATTTTTTPSKIASKPATTTTKTTTTATGGTMKACAAQWGALSATQKASYNTQATTMKSKSGGKLTGYNVWTGQCLKKK